MSKPPAVHRSAQEKPTPACLTTGLLADYDSHAGEIGIPRRGQMIQRKIAGRGRIGERERDGERGREMEQERDKESTRRVFPTW